MTGQEQALVERIRGVSAYMQSHGHEYWFLGLEDRDRKDRRQYDVRGFIGHGSPARLEISAHPPSIEADLQRLFSWLRSRTPLSIVDEDGEPSDW